MKREFNVIIEKDEDGFYVATVPSLKGCHTQAKSLDVLMERTKEAIELCLEEKANIVYPYDFVGVQKITVNEQPAKYTSTGSKKSVIGQNIKRTTHRSTSGKMLHVVRDKKGNYTHKSDSPTYVKVAKTNRKRFN